MSARDRMVATVAAVLVVLGAAWMLVVSPERRKATSLAGQVATAQSQLSSAEGELTDAQAAERQYAAAYSSVVQLGKAVPPTDEVPSLIYELQAAANVKNVEFTSATSANSASGSSAAAVAAASATPTAFTQVPFTFVFTGSYFQLEHMLEELDGFTNRTSAGLQVNGRLLTVQSLKVGPAQRASGAEIAGSPNMMLSGTIAATAYVLPANQTVTGGASASSPSSAAPAGSSSSAAPTPAVARVLP